MKKMPFLIILLFFVIVVAGCSGSEEVELEPLEGDISDLAEEFVAHLVDGQFDSAYAFFCAEMRGAMSEREPGGTWQQLLRQVGSYKESVEQHTERVEEYDVVILTAAFEKDLINIRMVFNEDRRISGLWFDPAE